MPRSRLPSQGDTTRNPVLRTVLVLSADARWSAALREELASLSDAAGFSLLLTDAPDRAAAYLERLRPRLFLIDADTFSPDALDLVRRVPDDTLVLLACSPPVASSSPGRRRIDRAEASPILRRFLRDSLD